MPTPINIDDTVKVLDIVMTVIEVKTSTDAEGDANFDTADVALRVEIVSSIPLVVSGDEWFACYVLEGTDDSGDMVYSVGVYDPWYGEYISEPDEKPIDITVPMAWQAGNITIMEDGVPVGAGETVNIMLIRHDPDLEECDECEDGKQTKRMLFLPQQKYSTCTEPYTAYTFETDANGVLKWNHPVEGAINLRFPKGVGAIGQRCRSPFGPGTCIKEDRDWNGDCPTRYTAEFRCYYEQEYVLIPRNGSAVTLDILSSTVTITADTTDTISYAIDCEVGVIEDVGGDGKVVATGLPPGEFSVVCFRQEGDDWDDEYLPERRIVTIEESGEDLTVDMPSLAFYDSAGGTACGYVYDYYGHPAAGIEIWWMFGIDTWGGIATTTDVNGFWSSSAHFSNLWVVDSTLGTAPIWGYPCSDVSMQAYLHSSLLDTTSFTRAWGLTHVPPPEMAVTVVRESTGEVIETEESAGGGWITIKPVPKYQYVTDADYLGVSGALLETYSIYVGDALVYSVAGLWSQSFDRIGSDVGAIYRAGSWHPGPLVVGGKIIGNIVAEKGGEQIEDSLREARRMGLEHGEWHIPQYQTYTGLPDADEPVRVASICGVECPYCHGQLVVEPGSARGYCPYDGVDGRTYFSSYPIPEHEELDLDIRHDRLIPFEKRSQLLTSLFYRPVDYKEEDAYIIGECPPGVIRWEDGKVRWVHAYRVLGQWRDGVYTEVGNSNDVASAYDISEDCGVRPKLRPRWQDGDDVYRWHATATYEIDMEYPNGEEVTLTVKIGAGGNGELYLLPRPVWTYSDEYEFLFNDRFTDVEPDLDWVGGGLIYRVTDIRFVDGDAAGKFDVVVDSPAVFACHPPIENMVATPYVLHSPLLYDFEWAYYIDVFGKHFRGRGSLLLGAIQTQTAQRELPWNDYQDTMEVDDFTGDLTIFGGGSKLYYSWTGDNGRHLAYSLDAGRTAVEAVDKIMAINWTHMISCYFSNMEYIVGRDTDGKFKCTVRNVITGARKYFTDGTQVSVITAGEDSACGLWATANGYLYADIPKSGGMERYRSNDGGSSWIGIDG